MSDLAAIHQKLSDALARYDCGSLALMNERRPDLIAAVREWDVARRDAEGAGGTEATTPGSRTERKSLPPAPPAEPAPPTATPAESLLLEMHSATQEKLAKQYEPPTPRVSPAGEGWPQAWSRCVKEAAERDCTPEWLLWDELEAARAQLAEAQRDVIEAAGEMMIPVPVPGTIVARLLSANRLLMQRAEAAERDLAECVRLRKQWHGEAGKQRRDKEAAEARERDLREKCAKWADAAIEYVDLNGDSHTAECPCDDTCSCEYKPVNDGMNNVIAAMRAQSSRSPREGGGG